MRNNFQHIAIASELLLLYPRIHIHREQALRGPSSDLNVINNHVMIKIPKIGSLQVFTIFGTSRNFEKNSHTEHCYNQFD